MSKWTKKTEYNLVPALECTFEHTYYEYEDARVYYSKEDKQWILEMNGKLFGYRTMTKAKLMAEMFLQNP